MKNVLTLTLAASIALVTLAAPVQAVSQPDAAAAAALGWLRAQQGGTGCIRDPLSGGCALAESGWATLAFRASGIDPATVRTSAEAPSLVDYLKSNLGSISDTATSWERTILAAVAAEGPAAAREFGGVDLVAELLRFWDGQQFGEQAFLNDDYFALLALHAAGFSNDAPVVERTREWVLLNQQANGGWSWGVVGPENEFFPFALGADVDDTAAALDALILTGGADAVEEAISSAATTRGFAFVKHLQFLDGGCMGSYFDVAFAAFGLSGNADSTSWAMLALNAASQDPEGTEWTSATGATLVSFLLSLQQEDGSFLWKPADVLGNPASKGFAPVATTVFAALALAGEDFVVVP